MNPELKVARIERSKAEKTTLRKEERVALLQMAQSPGYLVFLRLMEMGCVLQDAKLVAVEPGKNEEVLAEHRITVAKWELFDFIQKQVQQEINAISEEQPDLRTEEQKFADETLNP